MMNRISQYFEGVGTELKKVTWLSNEEVAGSTLVVAVVSFIMAIFLFVTDFGLSEVMAWFLGK